MIKLRCLAIDDEPIALEVIQLLSEKVPYLQLEGVFTDAKIGLEYLKNNSVDLVFLDIKMPKISGLDLARQLSSATMVVFTTAYAEHAVKSYELDAIDYLLKPFAFSRFLTACNKAYAKKCATYPENEFIFIKDGNTSIKVNVKEILYIEGAGNYLNVFTEKEKIILRSTLKDMLLELDPLSFQQIHKSYIIASNKVERFTSQFVVMKNINIPIGGRFTFIKKV